MLRANFYLRTSGKGKVMNRKILAVILISLIGPAMSLKGQVSFSGEEMASLLNNGYEMFAKAKYATAIGLFDRWLETEKTGTGCRGQMRSIMPRWPQ
jgi:hypothetical protein